MSQIGLWLGLRANATTNVSDSVRATTPFAVEYGLAPDASNKSGLLAIADSGARIFASSTLNPRNGGFSSFGGTVPFPQWVRISWRDGVEPGKYWTSGKIVADFKIDVQTRIPASFFEAARAWPGSIIKLQFRVKDDRVLFAWCVKKLMGGGTIDVLNDGDFKPAKRYNGVVVDPGWERS